MKKKTKPGAIQQLLSYAGNNKKQLYTVLINYPLYCPKCKRKSLIQAKQLHIVVIKEPDA